MPVKFAVFSGVASAGGASVAVMTSSSKRQRIERWYVRLHGWNTFALSLFLSLSLVGFHPEEKERLERKLHGDTSVESISNYLDESSLPLMDLWRPFVLSLLKRAGARTMGPKGSMNTLCPLSDERNHGWNNKRGWRGYFQISRHFLANEKRK